MLFIENCRIVAHFFTPSNTGAIACVIVYPILVFLNFLFYKLDAFTQQHPDRRVAVRGILDGHGLVGEWRGCILGEPGERLSEKDRGAGVAERERPHLLIDDGPPAHATVDISADDMNAAPRYADRFARMIDSVNVVRFARRCALRKKCA